MRDGNNIRSACTTMSSRIAVMVATAVFVPAFAFAAETDRVTVEDPATGAVMFRVTSGGNVTGTSFNGDGSGLTNVPHWKGAWTGVTTYNKDAVVSYGGSSYIALKQSIGSQPNLDASSWAVIAQQGPVGVQGPTGPQGAQGPAGSPDTQSQILSKIGAQADGASLSLQQGPTEPASAVKLGVADVTGAKKFMVTADGRVGVGGVPVSKFQLSTTETAQDIMASRIIYTTQSTTGYNNIGGFFDVTGAPATNSNAEVYALNGIARTAYGSTVNHNALYGLRFTAQHRGTGLLNSAIGVNAYPYNGSTGTINFAYGLYTRPWMASGTINNWYGMFVDTQNLGTGTIGSMYGVYVKEPKAVNYFAGNVGIGTTTPSQQLEINGGLRMNTASVKPACDAATRGTFWFAQGSGSEDDSVSVCSRIAGAFTWKVLY